MLTSGVFGFLLDYVIWWSLFLSIVIHTWCFFRFFPRRAAGVRLVLGNFLVFLCLLGGVALAAETYLRFVAVATDSFGMSLPARRWFAIHTKLNSLGCRDKEWSQIKPQAVRRILLLGDSFTYGWGIENPEDRFGELIQARFDAVKPGSVEIMNVAKPGWGTSDQINPLISMIAYGVDEVVLCHVPNDIEKLLPISDEFNPIRPPTPGFFNLESSPLMDYLYRRIYLPRVLTVRGYHDWLSDGYADSAIWNHQRQNFHLIAEQCRKRGVVFRVALLPFLRIQGSKFDQHAIHEKLRAEMEANHIPTVDLMDVLQDHAVAKLVVNSVDPHPNELAHRFFAERLWKAFWEPLRP